MKKTMMFCMALMLAFVLGTPSANAGLTLIQEDSSGDGIEGLMNSTETSTVEADSWITIQFIGGAPGMDEYRFGDQDFGWTHTFGPTDDKYIYDAQLTIMAWDVDFDQGERNKVYADGKLLGFLTGGAGEEWTETDFPISPCLLKDGQLNVWLDIDVLDGGWANLIDWSRLRVHWDYLADIEPPDSAVIPAPGAILLGSIGVGLVSWLRRRRTL